MDDNAVTGDLTGKIVLVTGGAQGIGEASARMCAQRGARVVLVDWNELGGQKTTETLRASGLDVDFYQADVGDVASVQSLMEWVGERYGRLDVMVCAAGIFRGAFQSPEELTVEDFDAVIDVNLKGVFLCTKYGLPLFRGPGQGVILIVGSGAGVIGPSGSLAYGASKGGVNGYGMTLPRHLGDRNIRVNVICPGGIATELKLGVVAVQAGRSGGSPEDAVAAARLELGHPDGVGKVIAFLASDDAAYVRGTLYTR